MATGGAWVLGDIPGVAISYKHHCVRVRYQVRGIGQNYTSVLWKPQDKCLLMLEIGLEAEYTNMPSS